MRTATEYRTASRDTYERFKHSHPGISISYKDWSRVIIAYNQTIRDYILESGDLAKMPFGMGLFCISKKKCKKFITLPDGTTRVNLPVDWKRTKEQGKYVYNFNNHTDGYRYKWMWFPSTACFYQANIWNFKPYRTSSRKLAEYIKKPNSRYSEIYKEWR